MEPDNITSNAPVVVLGLGPTGLGAVRSLDKSSLRDVRVIGVYESLREVGAYSRLCDERYYCEGFGSLKLIDNLIELGRKFSVRPILILTDDRSVMLVSRNRDRLGPYYDFLLPSNDVVELLVDKTRFALYASRNGFSVPKTWVINDRDDLEKASSQVRFPCFLKPKYRDGQWLKMVFPKGFRSENSDELMALYEKIQSVEQHYVLQEWIQGPDSELYFCQVLFDNDARCIASFTCNKLRQWPTEAGVTSMAEPAHCTEIERETIRLFESLQMKGLGAVEFKHDARDGRYKIMEPRIGRVGTTSETATANGVNFPELLYSYLTKKNIPKKPLRHPVRWIQEEDDVQSCLHLIRSGKLSLSEMARSYAGPKCLALFSWKDPLPLLMILLKDLRGTEWGSLWSTVGWSAKERKRSDVIGTAEFLNQRYQGAS